MTQIRLFRSSCGYYLHFVKISTFRGYYPHFVDISLFLGYYLHFMEISTFHGYDPHFVDIIRIQWILSSLVTLRATQLIIFAMFFTVLFCSWVVLVTLRATQLLMYVLVLIFTHIVKVNGTLGLLGNDHTLVYYPIISYQRIKVYTFSFNGKSSILKLLYTFARLFKGTPLQPLQIDFISHPRSQYHNCHFYHFHNITRGKARKSHERALLPNLPTPMASRPKPSPTYPPTR